MRVTLNEEQKQIVRSPVGQILVISAAGTGKTRVLTERIIYLMQKGGVDPSEILAITFTNMAAEEMKKRMQKRLSNPNNIPDSVGTIHSIFGDVLRRDIDKVCPHRQHNFEILQEEGQNWAITKAFQLLNLPSFHHKTTLNTIRGLLSDWKTGRFLNISLLTEDQIFQYEPIFLEYEKVLQSKNYLDFDDVLTMTTQLLASNEDIRSYWANKYKTILIDEVQDLNEIQWRLVKTIINPETTNLLAVGDPNQCIYLFNRAKENIFDEIKQTFPSLSVYHLTQNYRSTKQIVEFSNEIKHVKYFPAVSNNFDEGLVKHCSSIDEAINELIKTKDYSKWAILFPKYSNAKKIIELLIKNSIPFKTSRFHLLENSYIEKLILLFQAIFFDNSQLLERLLCLKEFMISGAGRKEILNQDNWPPKFCLSQFLLESDEWKDLNINSQDMIQLGIFIKQIKELRKLPQDNLAGMVPHLKECLFSNSKLTPGNLHKIDLFIEWLQNIQPVHSVETSDDIVMSFRQYSEFTKSDINKQVNNSVTLSTVHKSKGLEWEKIIILEYGYLEQESQNKTKDKHLAYVAATRAKSQLFLVQ